MFQDYWYVPNNFHDGRYGHSDSMWKSRIVGTDGDKGLDDPSFQLENTLFIQYFIGTIPVNVAEKWYF